MVPVHLYRLVLDGIAAVGRQRQPLLPRDDCRRYDAGDTIAVPGVLWLFAEGDQRWTDGRAGAGPFQPKGHSELTGEPRYHHLFRGFSSRNHCSAYHPLHVA
jgi:hypothetical protein